MTDWKEPAFRIDEFTDDILDFCESDHDLFLEMVQVREKFLTKTPGKYYQTPDEEDMAEMRFNDYFIYDYTSKNYKKKPIDVFLSKMLHKYNQRDKEIIQGFNKSIFSGFTISAVLPGYYFIAKDVCSGKEYKVRKNRATFQFKKDDYFIGRILPFESDYVLSGINLFLPDEFSYLAKRSWRDLPMQVSDHINPLMIEREILQRSKSKRIEDENVEYYTQEPIEIIEKKLRNFLKKRMGKKAPSIKSLRKKINRITEPTPLIEELLREMHISSQEEFIKFQQLFNDFWNRSPRDEFQGKSPEEVASESMGPVENELLNEFMKYAKKNIDITKFSNKDEMEQTIRSFQEKWLNEPQEKLNGKTPFQVMREERERIHSPRKGFPINFQVNPINLRQEDHFHFNNINEKDSPVVRDIETFVSYFLENRIKVTRVNRWIPFKHLKIITKNFISPDRDEFIDIGYEECWGQEQEKIYIHFIHLLAQAAQLIYTDKQGYVQVNQDHFKNFTENNYGENVFKLLIDWIEKVNWEDLYPAAQVKPYAQEYQEKIVGLWPSIHELKPYERIDTISFTKYLYYDDRKGEEELEEIARELSMIVDSVLLRYLNWFGVIDAQKVKYHPRLLGWTIKEFWITNNGRKLADRVVLDFWEKGKIKMKK